MTSRAFCIPGVLFLLAATVLLIITSISLPFLPDIDFVRSHVNSGNIGVANAQGNVVSPSISQLKVRGLVSDASGRFLTAVFIARIVVLLHHRVPVWKPRLQHHWIRLQRPRPG